MTRLCLFFNRCCLSWLAQVRSTLLRRHTAASNQGYRYSFFVLSVNLTTNGDNNNYYIRRVVFSCCCCFSFMCSNRERRFPHFVLSYFLLLSVCTSIIFHKKRMIEKDTAFLVHHSFLVSRAWTSIFSTIRF